MIKRLKFVFVILENLLFYWFGKFTDPSSLQQTYQTNIAEKFTKYKHKL
jgi:hypothetical protein